MNEIKRCETVKIRENSIKQDSEKRKKDKQKKGAKIKKIEKLHTKVLPVIVFCCSKCVRNAFN